MFEKLFERNVDEWLIKSPKLFICRICHVILHCDVNINHVCVCVCMCVHVRVFARTIAYKVLQ